MSDELLYLLWSMRKNAWYGPDCAGYTNDIARAGRYERAEAGDLAMNCLPGQLIPVDEQLAQNALDGLTGADVTARIDSYRGY